MDQIWEGIARDAPEDALVDMCAALETEMEKSEAPQEDELLAVRAVRMLAHLAAGELDQARHVWLRAEAKKGTIVGQAWGVTQAMWRSSWAEFHAAVQPNEWPAPAAPLLARIVATARQANVVLLARAYSTIRLSDVATIFGMPEQETAAHVASLGWTVDASDASFVVPSPVSNDDSLIGGDIDLLAKLTSHIGALEAQ